MFLFQDTNVSQTDASTVAGGNEIADEVFDDDAGEPMEGAEPSQQDNDSNNEKGRQTRRSSRLKAKMEVDEWNDFVLAKDEDRNEGKKRKGGREGEKESEV